MTDTSKVIGDAAPANWDSKSDQCTQEPPQTESVLQRRHYVDLRQPHTATLRHTTSYQKIEEHKKPMLMMRSIFYFLPFTGFNTLKLHIKVSSMLIMAPALSNSPQ
mmetsp:Transcript_54924/g.146672  ORF Transcript_54924/g.146672 Transcript_54924/m.146672 type:complete len:106 (+) Transcript_54924:45-362(+)